MLLAQEKKMAKNKKTQIDHKTGLVQQKKKLKQSVFVSAVSSFKLWCCKNTSPQQQLVKIKMFFA